MYIFTTLVTTIPFLFTFATARPQARALLPSVDTCANIDVNILTLLNIPDATNSGHLQACLCASTVGPFVQANAQASLASSLVGEDTVVNALLNVILGMGSQCMYPVHAVSLCLAEAPCDFGCTDGYTRVDSTCVCQAPKIECNGVFQTQACSSAVPQRRNLDTQSRMRALTEERCPPGSQLCGRGSSWKRGDDDWECIDINTSLDSCGGCTYPYVLDDSPVRGVDCTAIPYISDVECRNGRCLVHQCKEGCALSPSRLECVSETE